MINTCSEVDTASLSIGEPTVLEDLQQRVEDIRCAFSTSSKSTTENGLRRTASVTGRPRRNRLARRRADQPRDRVLFHVPLMSSWISAS